MWTEAKEELLRDLWDRGFSASEIGRQIGKSRNAVLGKKDRLGLKERKPHRRPRLKTPKPAPEPRLSIFPTAPSVLLPDPAPHERVSLLDRKAGQCKFPLGDPKHDDFGFCGRKRVPGQPYCPSHAARAYRGTA